MKNLLLLAVAFLGLSFTYHAVSAWQIAEDYVIKFDGRGATGTFSELTGEIIFDENDLANSRINVSVKTATIETGNNTKNKHARGESWFDAETYPTIGFTSEKFTKTATGYTVTGIFNMHGVEKQETILFTFENNIFNGKVTIDRQEYGIEGPFLAFTVADDFAVEIRVPVRK